MSTHRNIGSWTLKHLLTGCFVLPAFFGAQAQSLCDSIHVGTIHYNALDSQFIDVPAWSDASGCVSYPMFILYDMNGDTLAKETVNFFCINFVEGQTHPMQVQPGASLPNGPFPVILELFTGFGDSLVCSWDLTIELCPTDSCVLAEIYLTNTDTLEAGNVYWFIWDENGSQAASGVITMDLMVHTHFDSVCLPPGDYQLFLSPFSDIWIDEDYILGITPGYFQSIGTNTAQQNDSTPGDLMFTWFEACADFTNAVEEVGPIDVSMVQSDHSLTVRSPEGTLLRDLLIVNMQGQVVQHRRTLQHEVSLNIGQFSKGIYIIRAAMDDGTVRARRFVIP